MNSRSKMFFIFFALTLFSTATIAQDVLMTVAGKEVTVEEFERIYKKNNNSLNTNQQTPEEYAELFINFKLKVAEAENLGMDTAQSFLAEFNKYKEQLAQPYLTDDETREELMKEAYERALSDVHVSHILINLNSQASDEVALAAYEKTVAIRQRILDGEDFATVAKATSDDPSAKTNGGDLGYFTVFSMLYSFESMAYSMEPGEVSEPVKTRFGYHILKLHDKRPAIGQVKVGQIFVRSPQDFPREDAQAAKERMEFIYDSITGGSDFKEICQRHSDDRSTAESGGELPYFGTGRMFPEFEKESFSLKYPGEISKPFKSSYGWHLVKLLDKKPIGTYEEMESTLQTSAVRGDRNAIKKARYLEKLKENYDYQLNEENYQRVNTLINESVKEADWNPDIPPADLSLVLFETSKGNKTLGEFVEFIQEKAARERTRPQHDLINTQFSGFVETTLTKIEKSSLPDRYPEYKYILREYHDGILLFDLMDRKVWTHAVEDTLGLEAFHKENKNNYMWGERVNAIIVSCDSTVDIAKVKSKTTKISGGKWDQEKLNKKYCNSDSGLCISLEEIKAEVGTNDRVDALNKVKGAGETYNEMGRNKFVIVKAIMPPAPKELNETRGQVTSDYQDHLEKLWLEELRNKYSVKVNKDLLSKIEQ